VDVPPKAGHALVDRAFGGIVDLNRRRRSPVPSGDGPVLRTENKAGFGGPDEKHRCGIGELAGDRAWPRSACGSGRDRDLQEAIVTVAVALVEYTVANPVPLSLIQNGEVADCEIPQGFTRLGSVRSATPAVSAIKLC
jgi:hypothetical protein